MFKSIRASMLAWQAVILCLAVGGFGVSLYREVRHTNRVEADANLLGVAHTVAAAIDWNDEPPQPGIPATYLARFGRRPEDAPYFIAWDDQQRVIARSLAAPDVAPPERPQPKGERPRAYYARDRESAREMILQTPAGAVVLAGKSIRKEVERLDRLLAWTIGSAAGVIGLALVGGWLLSRRVLAPIDRMSRAAEQISASNLSQRLDTGSAKSELGRLARVLNDMFARLQAAFEQQARFTADASHELRTPVAVVLAQAEQALARERSPDEYRQALEACQRAARRMKSLAEALLVLARADAGQSHPRLASVALQEVVQSSLTLAQPYADERQVCTHQDLQPIQSLADAEQFGQVVLNLLTNAIQYNRPGGEVTVALVREGDEAVLSVADNGPGIAPEHLGRIFERFYRVDPARGGRGGSGLGLAICKEIVEAHGGSIGVSSQEGQGSVFTVRLPVRKEV